MTTHSDDGILKALLSARPNVRHRGKCARSDQGCSDDDDLVASAYRRHPFALQVLGPGT